MLIIFSGWIKILYYHWYSSTLWAQESKSDNNSLGTLMRPSRSSGISISICSGFRYISTWLGCGVGLAGLGIWWIHRYSWLLDTGFLDHTESSRSAVGSIPYHQSQLMVGVSHPKLGGRLLDRKATNPWVAWVWRERWDIVLP